MKLNADGSQQASFADTVYYYTAEGKLRGKRETVILAEGSWHED